jgi:hypothetical protein
MFLEESLSITSNWQLFIISDLVKKGEFAELLAGVNWKNDLQNLTLPIANK